MGLVVKAWRYYREHGLRDFAHRIHRRRKFFVYVKDLPAPPPVPEDPEVCFRLAGPEDVDWLAGQLTHWGSGAREALGEMLRAGDRAVIGVRRCGRGGLTYISWLSSRDPLLVALRGVSPGPLAVPTHASCAFFCDIVLTSCAESPLICSDRVSATSTDSVFSPIFTKVLVILLFFTVYANG